MYLSSSVELPITMGDAELYLMLVADSVAVGVLPLVV
jgi:hypothetical protein